MSHIKKLKPVYHDLNPAGLTPGRFTLILIFISLLTGYCSTSVVRDNKSESEKPVIIMDIPGYPLVFELNIGDSIHIDRSYNNKRVTRTIRLVDFRLLKEFNNWFPDTLGMSDIYKGEVDIVVSGKKFTLNMQPYQAPIIADSLRLYVEAIKLVDDIPNLDPVENMQKAVRLSITLEGEPWGVPSDLVFPVEDYRWRSASYNNTWGALVPFNLLYYHRGEDFGAIPDKLNVSSWVDGIVIRSPLSGQKNGSNSIRIKDDKGLEFGFSHCNTEFIDSSIMEGRKIKKGGHIARTGMTWDGRKSQHSDPHLHMDMSYNGFQISLFPYSIEAYFRKYDDKILAIAGGYRFSETGETMELDGSRSICRNGEKIKSWQWKLHDGQIVNQTVAKTRYNSPGYYSEELVVTTESGAIDRDFLQVRVNDNNSTGKIAYGWAYYYPVRNIKPGEMISFWNRLINTENAVTIDFGDGTAVQTIKDDIKYAYKNRGTYVVELKSRGPGNEPVSIKLEVIVE